MFLGRSWRSRSAPDPTQLDGPVFGTRKPIQHLTAKGRKNARRSWEVLMALEQELSEYLGARRLAQLRKVLLEILDSTAGK